MLAIFKTGGKQYSARAGQILKVEKLEGSKGDKVSITDVLAISDQSTNSLGEPLLKDATIEAKIVDQIRDKKIQYQMLHFRPSCQYAYEYGVGR